LIFQTTPSQTVGPYFAIGLPFDAGPFTVPEDTPGAFHVTGTIYDGAGVPIPDFLLETWQSDAEGRFADMYGHGGPSQLDGFRGFARYGLEDGDGTFDILTVKPGPVPGLAGQTQAPHIDVSLFARGMLHRTVTRIYFADETEANASDPVLAGCRSSAAPRCSPSRPTAATGSTSASRGRTRPCSSRSENARPDRDRG
jgi:protocatechuate 3,4-dioxygenase alpha subunit